MAQTQTSPFNTFEDQIPKAPKLDKVSDGVGGITSITGKTPRVASEEPFKLTTEEFLKRGEKPYPIGEGDFMKAIQPIMDELTRKSEEYGQFQGLEKEQEARSLAQATQMKADAKRKEKLTIEESPEFSMLKQKTEELNDLEFVPTKDNAKDIAGLFSLVGLIGFAIGGSGKENSIQAMSAMNGMLDGYQKGRVDLYKREKDIFDTNFKALKTKVETLTNRLKQIAELAAVDSQAAYLEADVFLASERADFVKQYLDKYKLPLTIKLLENTLKLTTEAEKNRQDLIVKAQDRSDKYYLAAYNQLQDQGKGGYTSALLAGRAENIREAFVQAAQDLENVSRFPKNTVLGTFAGMTGLEGNNLMTSLSRTFTRQIGNTESRMLQQLVSGLETNLAMALGGGYATSAAKYKIDQYKTQIPKEGDDGWVTATFLARIRQELNILNDNFPSKPGATPEMSAAVKAANDKINKVIPFTVEDITNAKFGTKETVAQKSQSMIEKPKTLEEFLVKARAKNPNASDEQLTNFYNKKYGIKQ